MKYVEHLTNGKRESTKNVKGSNLPVGSGIKGIVFTVVYNIIQ